jgi:hypothetical protein
MGRVTRRRLLQVSRAAAAAAQTAGALAGRAPAFVQRRNNPSNGPIASSQSMSDR